NDHDVSGRSSNGLAPIDDPVVTSNFKAYQVVAAETLSQVRRSLPDLVVRGPPEPQTVIITVGRDITLSVEGVSFIALNLLNPLAHSRILSAIPASVQRVVVLEQVYSWTTKWTPVYLEIVSALQHRDAEHRPLVLSGILGDVGDVTSPDVLKIIHSPTSP